MGLWRSPRACLAREVSTEEGQKKAAELGVQFVETSAKANIAVGDASPAIALHPLAQETGASRRSRRRLTNNSSVPN